MTHIRERYARRVHHVREQTRKRKEAIAETHGNREAMEQRGYVPNGKGGWRRLAQPKAPKRNSLDKE